MRIVRIILKYIFRILVGVFLLFVFLIIIIQINFVQNFLADKAIVFLSKKTNSVIRLNKIGVKFPNKIFLSEIYLEDQHHDTLLYAGELKLSPDFFEIIKGNISINSIILDDAVVNLSRLQSDSTYNYNFLVESFSKPDKSPKVQPDSSKGLNLNLDKIQLHQVRFSLEDKYAGISCGLSVKELNLRINELDLKKFKFDIRSIDLNTFVGNLVISKSPKESNSVSKQPQIKVHTLTVSNSAFAYKNTPDQSDLLASINKFNLQDALYSPENYEISIKSLALSNSVYRSNSIADTSLKTLPVNKKSNSENPWKIKADKIDLSKNEISINKTNLPNRNSTFDNNHLNYKGVSLLLHNLQFSSSLTAFKLDKLSLESEGNFVVKKIASTFKMTRTSIQLDETQIETSHSKIDLSALLKFTSLTTLSDSIQNLQVNAEFNPTLINTSDILYFSPQLAKQNYFRGSGKEISLSGRFTGKVGDLKGEKISIKTAQQTELFSDFIISGLPDIKHANFILPNLFIKSGRNDLISILGNNILPPSLNLPLHFSIKADFRGRLKDFTGNINMVSDQGNLKAFAFLDEQENFHCKISSEEFNLGKLLKNEKMLGPATLKADIEGKGLDVNKIEARVIINAESIELNQYNYHLLSIDGKVLGRQFDGKINLNDTNAVFDFQGLVNLDKGNEIYNFTLDLKGADLKKLHFSDEDLRISLTAISDLKGNTIDNINGTAGITKIIIAHNGKKYVLDSILVASINKEGKSEMNLKSAIVGIKYNGTFSPGSISKEIKKHINRYFPLGTDTQTVISKPQKFNFEIELHNNALISEVFLPKLNEFETVLIAGDFDSEQNKLSLNVSIPHVKYDGIEVKDLKLDINSDEKDLNYKLFIPELLNPSMQIKNLDLNGKLTDQKASINISSIEEDQKTLEIHSEVLPESDYYKFHILPTDFFLGNKSWTLPEDNFIAFGKPGIWIHNISLKQSGDELSINSIHDKFKDDFKIVFSNFSIENITDIVQKDTSLVSGIIDGEILLKQTVQNFGIIANLNIKDLEVRKNAIGNIAVKASNPQAGKFDFNLNISGLKNDIQMNGYYNPSDSLNGMHVKADINALTMESIQAFANQQISNSSGLLTGKITVDGSSADPKINGSVTLKDAYTNPALLNMRFHFKDETINLKNNSVYLNNFTIEDPNGNTASINGSVQITKNSPFVLDLGLDSRDFTLFNTTEKDNKVYYGKMIIDSRVQVKGTSDLPIITSRIQLKEGSNFTFAVPEKKINSDKGEGVVEFDSLKFHPILIRDETATVKSSAYKGLDISSTIEVNEKAVLRLMVDPETKDSLVVQGSASLGFTLDPSGKISLTGSYNLSEGSYLVSLKSLIKRKFAIEKGSTIVWNGDPLDADVNINAIYSIRTSPIDLIGNEIAGLSETDRNTYRQRLPFLVYLKLKGPLLKPDISFEIQLPPDQKGAMGGVVNAKLIQLNEDPSALNKQVFALLVLRRFIQENPLESANQGSAASNLARSSVSSFLTAQLNQYGSNIVPGVELNFDVQSYDDYSSGQAEGRTQLGLGVQKQLLNDRLSVQVGGTVDVEGQRAQENSASNITGDVTVEYKLTEDGRYRLKGFRHNQYEGALEGQLVETGVGLLYSKDFNEWKELFKSNRKESKDLNENENSDEKN